MLFGLKCNKNNVRTTQNFTNKCLFNYLSSITNNLILRNKCNLNYTSIQLLKNFNIILNEKFLFFIYSQPLANPNTKTKFQGFFIKTGFLQVKFRTKTKNTEKEAFFSNFIPNQKQT